MEICCADRTNLCSRCLDNAYAQLRGVAENRGHFWAGDVEMRATASQRARAWPVGDQRMIAVAREKLADLSSCPALIEALLPHAVRAALRRWSSP